MVDIPVPYRFLKGNIRGGLRRFDNFGGYRGVVPHTTDLALLFKYIDFGKGTFGAEISLIHVSSQF